MAERRGRGGVPGNEAGRAGQRCVGRRQGQAPRPLGPGCAPDAAVQGWLGTNIVGAV
ncbi:MAG: hypothetical protein OJF60_000074 [Burkholderiaceae bacterium]|nr:MAG: hypothetical protein OJF60_000074 [Burkholderiaceae bacterium]